MKIFTPNSWYPTVRTTNKRGDVSIRVFLFRSPKTTVQIASFPQYLNPWGFPDLDQVTALVKWR